MSSMKAHFCEAASVAALSFGLPLMCVKLPDAFLALAGFASAGLSIFWAALVFQIIETFGCRGAWILVTAPVAFFWWWPLFAFAGDWLCR